MTERKRDMFASWIRDSRVGTLSHFDKEVILYYKAMKWVKCCMSPGLRRNLKYWIILIKLDDSQSNWESPFTEFSFLNSLNASTPHPLTVFMIIDIKVLCQTRFLQSRLACSLILFFCVISLGCFVPWISFYCPLMLLMKIFFSLVHAININLSCLCYCLMFSTNKNAT